MKKQMKKSSSKKGKRTHRGWKALAEQDKKKRQRKMDPENVTSQGNFIKMRNQKSQTNHPIPVTSILRRNTWIVKMIDSARMMW